ncbi:recombinase family protein [Paraburkholderia sp. 22B1P]|uniref:recombinase family protein n=1 Tax=Paraburkholderia sp. 22B1P TaxID=3080498 RepID=UPI00308D8ED6|nr:recombinase family protein [Paraburkholderia sp. 22B1P]BEU27494.1 recombinase family protein [Paraburkholderia sp. 22B1P]BEU28107.1 recombinase family protein [Paraburkholderia sp. 22B1P]BEU28451.1 recombinase family protein [Paraburkholderia sp. 22B1P]
MTNADRLPAPLLQRKAVVYVRQSTQAQVQMNVESKRRQYELAGEAKRRGFRDIEVIDDDLGRSASGTVARPGFERLVALLCAGEVGAVLCLDASRLARNGRDWHHLLELCGLVQARVIDLDGVYDPCRPNDRLLLGMKGSISEFELNIIRTRMLDAARAKAQRGELRISVPIGYLWHRDIGLGLDPDQRLQEVIRLIFSRFRELGSARQAFLSLLAEQIHFPRPTDGRTLTQVDWTLIRYRNVISVLRNPFYAGAYAYGKSGSQTTIVDGRAHKTYKHRKPFDQWEVMLKEHHEGYIEWAEFERNQRTLAANAYGKAGDVKSGRGGRALLAGMLGCARCGRRLSVAYTGRTPRPVYRCYRFDLPPKCMSFGGSRIDVAIARELMRVVEPMAIEAAFLAEQMRMDTMNEQRRIIELELQQAGYEAILAERRYAACDPDNRLIAAQLEKNWEAALRRVQACQTRLDAADAPATPASVPDFTKLAEDLDAAWNAPHVNMRTRQQLVRALIVDIVADVEESTREVILTIHWQGGQHSQLRIRKPRTGEHGCNTSDEALAVIRSMATRWSDQDIAASLNRMGIRTGQGKTWTAHRVSSVRRVRDIYAYKSAEKDGDWLTMSEAAKALGVTHYMIRRLINDKVLPAEQVMPDAPWQIRASDLRSEAVTAALTRKHRPCRNEVEGQLPMFTEVSQGGAQ